MTSDKWLEKKGWDGPDKQEMVSFVTNDSDCWSVLFARLSSVCYVFVAGQVLVTCELGTFIVEGPKAKEFHDDFVAHKAAVVRPDGDGITSVTLVLADS